MLVVIEILHTQSLGTIDQYQCDRTKKVIKTLLLAWAVVISLIAQLVECGPHE